MARGHGSTTRRGAEDEGNVIQAGDNDVLVFNRTGRGGAPGGILIPAKSLVGILLGEGDAAWTTALSLVEQDLATAFPVRAFSALSEGTCDVTLLMPGVDDEPGDDNGGSDQSPIRRVKSGGPARKPASRAAGKKAKAKKKKR